MAVYPNQDQDLPYRQCTQVRADGSRCRGAAILLSPQQKCANHGGSSTRHLKGINNPQFKTGRYSKYLPSRLAELYEQAVTNPELLEMRDHLALLDTRIQDILRQTQQGDPAPRWAEVKERFADFETAILGGDQTKVIESLTTLHALLDAGETWDRAWDQILETMEQLRKVADTEVKRQKELNQMIPVERVVILMAAMGAAVKRHVKDPEEIRAVLGEISNMYRSNRSTSGGAHERVDNDFDGINPRPIGELTLRQRLLAERDKNIIDATPNQKAD